VLERVFSDPNGSDKTETLTQYAGDYPVAVPAGRHTIRVVNPGTDWLEVSYRLPQYVEVTQPALRVLGLKGPRLTLAWVQNLDHTWFRRSLGAPLRPVAPSFLTLAGFAAGDYEVELWDTYEGKLLQPRAASPEAGRVRVALPEITKDLALKIRSPARS
jgi:hypothetical protein